MILTKYEVVVGGEPVARHEDFNWCCDKALEVLETFPEAQVSIEGGPRYHPEGELICRN